MLRTSIVVLALSSLLFACGGGSKAASTSPAEPAPAQTEAAAPADQTKATDTAATADAPAADQPAPPPATAPAADPSGDEILAFVQALADVIEANASDCDAMGDNMSAHLDTNPALVKYMNGMTGTDAHKKWLADNKEAFAKITKKMMAIGNCMGNAKVKAAMTKFN